MSAEPLVIPFMPVSGNEFAGYDLGMAKTVRIRFNVDGSGSVTGLTVQGENGNVTAGKTR